MFDLVEVVGISSFKLKVIQVSIDLLQLIF
jgi:hypothetical protein